MKKMNIKIPIQKNTKHRKQPYISGKEVLPDLCYGILLWGFCCILVQKIAGEGTIFPVFLLPVLILPCFWRLWN